MDRTKRDTNTARPRRRSRFLSWFTKRTKGSTETVAVSADPTDVTVSKTVSPWFDGLLQLCLAYLDVRTLIKCELVAKDWHGAAQGPTLWTAQYCARWRHGEPLPAVLATAFSRSQFARVCRERSAVSLELSTRASWWVHEDDRTVHVLNVVLDSRPSDVVGIHTATAMRPLGLSRPLDDHHSEGVCYYEVTIRGRGSVGVARVERGPTTTAQAWCHIGHLPGSYGYHGSDGHVYWGDGAPHGYQRTVAYGPSWGYHRGERTPASDERSTTIGCGLDLTARRLFFTKNGAFLGFAPIDDVEAAPHGYRAAVALENRADTAELNLGRAPFVFDVETFLAERMTTVGDKLSHGP